MELPWLHFFHHNPSTLQYHINSSTLPAFFYIFHHHSCSSFTLSTTNNMKRIVLKVELYGDRIKQKAMKVASGISGVDSVAMEVEDKKMTIVGEIDAVKAVKKLRKLCHTDIVSVGSADEEQKKVEEANNKDDAEAVEYYHNYYAAPPSQYCYCCHY